MPKPVSHILIPIAAILVAGVVVFCGGVHGEFYFDDHAGIVQNPEIEKLWPPAEAFAAPEKSAVSGRPIVALSLAVNYVLGGRDPFGYHVFNLAVHLINGLLIFWIVRKTVTLIPITSNEDRATDPPVTSGNWLALGIALVWLVHPVQTETVVGVIQRTELLVVMFYLLTLACAIRAWTAMRCRAAWVWLAVVSCALGMGSKEVMASAPIMVLLYDRAFISRTFRAAVSRHWPLYAGLTVTWSIFVAILLTVPRGNSVGFDLGISWLDYLRTQAPVIVHYLGLTFWPHPLVAVYDWPILETWGPAVLPGALITGLLGLTIWAIVKNHPLGVVGALFFLVLAPSSSIVPIVTEIAADRRMYLPVLAVIVVSIFGARWVFVHANKSRAWTWTGPVIVGGVIVALAGVTIDRVRDFRTELSIWQTNYDVLPGRHQSNAGLGVALGHLGRFEEAIPYLERAVKLKPDDVFSRQNLGLAYARTGQYHEAIRHYREALRRRPDVPESHHNLGAALGEVGEFEEAVHHLREADRLRPDHPPTLANLASIRIRDPLSAVFDSARAVQYAVRASALTGDENAAILQILAKAYAADGQYEAAVLVAERARQRAETTGQDELAAELALLVAQYRARAGED